MERVEQKTINEILLPVLMLVGMGVSIIIDPSKIWAETWRDFIANVTILVILLITAKSLYVRIRSIIQDGWRKIATCSILVMNVLAALCTTVVVGKFLIEKIIES